MSDKFQNFKGAYHGIGFLYDIKSLIFWGFIILSLGLLYPLLYPILQKEKYQNSHFGPYHIHYAIKRSTLGLRLFGFYLIILLPLTVFLLLGLGMDTGILTSAEEESGFLESFVIIIYLICSLFGMLAYFAYFFRKYWSTEMAALSLQHNNFAFKSDFWAFTGVRLFLPLLIYASLGALLPIIDKKRHQFQINHIFWGKYALTSHADGIKLLICFMLCLFLPLFLIFTPLLIFADSFFEYLGDIYFSIDMFFYLDDHHFYNFLKLLETICQPELIPFLIYLLLIPFYIAYRDIAFLGNTYLIEGQQSAENREHFVATKTVASHTQAYAQITCRTKLFQLWILYLILAILTCATVGLLWPVIKSIRYRYILSRLEINLTEEMQQDLITAEKALL